MLSRVDRVLAGLHITSLATALVARIEQDIEQAPEGRRILRWSSAGHLPPLVLAAGGAVHVLHSIPERLLGANPYSSRSDHETELQAGDTVVFYTDGIVEYGRSGIDEGITRLTGFLSGLSGLSVDELSDQLLCRLVPGSADDDIAILVLRCLPEH